MKDGVVSLLASYRALPTFHLG